MREAGGADRESEKGDYYGKTTQIKRDAINKKEEHLLPGVPLGGIPLYEVQIKFAFSSLFEVL